MGPNSLTIKRQTRPYNIDNFIQEFKAAFYQVEEVTVHVRLGERRNTVELQKVAETSRYEVSREAAIVAILEIANLAPVDVEALIDEVLGNCKEFSLVIKKR